jgi:crossover junction endodeoxyribonuclease RuvC
MAAAFIGIDPGAGGAIAILWSDGDFYSVEDTPMIGKEIDYLQLLQELRLAAGGFVIIERQGFRPTDRPMTGFRLGQHVASWKMAASICECPFQEVTPQKWRNKMVGVGADKEASRAKAIELFPAARQYLQRKKDEGRAEALLIAEYGRRYLWGTNKEGE